MLCVLLLVVDPVRADMVWMKNGDRLSGQIRQIDQHNLLLNTSYGGLLSLDLAQISRIEDESYLDTQDLSQVEDYLDAHGIVTNLEAVSVSHSMQAVDTVVVHNTQDKQYSIWDSDSWRGRIDVGFNHKNASTRSKDYAVNLGAEARHLNWRHKLNINYMHKTDDSVTSSHNYGASLSSDRFVSEKFFWQARALYKWDQIEDVSRQSALGIGPGYQLWDNEQGAFSLAGLVGKARYGYSDAPSERFYSLSLRWDYNRFIGGDRFEVYSHGELMRPLNSSANVSLDATVGVRYRMTDWVSWYMSYSHSRISGGPRKLNEKRTSTGLGLTW